MADRESTYWDRQEVRSSADREFATFGALPGLIRHAIDNAPFYAGRFDGIDLDAINNREALIRLPVIREQEHDRLNREGRNVADLLATPVSRLARLHRSNGPVYSPESKRSDYWRFARALFAAGFRPGQLIHNGLHYHLVTEGFMADAGARAIGCPVVPAGDAPIDDQLDAIEAMRPDGYVGRPSSLITLMRRAKVLSRDVKSIKRALVTGELFFGSKREYLEQEFGLTVHQCYATSQAGLIAYESEAREGLLVDESLIVEILAPQGNEPLGASRVGEVVVTVFNPDYPLIRFATGDLSSILPGLSPCGRTNMRLTGWHGRVRDLTVFRDKTIHPEMILKVADHHNLFGAVSLIVTDDRLLFEHGEEEGDPVSVPEISATLREALGLDDNATIDVTKRQMDVEVRYHPLVEDRRTEN